MKQGNILSDQWREYSAAIPGLKIKFKDESLWWRMSPEPMRAASTTLGKTIFLPSEKWFEASSERAFAVLAHEFQHAMDRQRFGFLGFYLRYTFPQIIGIIPLICACVSIALLPWLATVGLFILTAIAIMPWRSCTRTDIERRGYAMTCAVDFLFHGKIREHTKEYVISAMSGWFYYRMASVGDAVKLFHEIEDNVTGPRWPRGLAAFAPTVGAMLESNAVCDVARAAFRWPITESAATPRDGATNNEQSLNYRKSRQGSGTPLHPERDGHGQV